MIGKYDDIICLPHHVSDHRPQMRLSDRAAQFAPFAALSGYEDAIIETTRQTSPRIELEKDRKEELDFKLRLLNESLENRPSVTFTYFEEDMRKSGGEYLTVSGVVKKIDFTERTFLLESGLLIYVDDILDMESSIFPTAY